MKFRLLALATLVAFTLSSCSKEGDNDPGSSADKISADLDGAHKAFNYSALALRFDAGGAYSVQIIGFEGAAGGNQVALAISSLEPITTGVYTEDGTGATGTNIGLVSFIPAGSSDPFFSSQSDLHPATITVTAISATSIEGTFSGDIFRDNGIGAAAQMLFTNGQFKLNF